MARSSYKRALTTKAASRCEAALGAHCFCRCEGTFHGISHLPYQQIEARVSFEEAVPLEKIRELVRTSNFRIVDLPLRA